MGDQVASSRRKSCEACQTAKRRCDLTFPFCSRCVSKNLSCVYPGRQPSAYPDFAEGVPVNVRWQQTSMIPISDRTGVYPVLNPVTNLHSSLPKIDDGHWQYPHHMLPNQWLAASENLASPSSYSLLERRARPPKPLSEIVASRFQFAIDVLKGTPRMMVIENQTAWCHRQLYKNHMPKAMKDAYTCCSLYMSKNEINAPVIMSLISDRMRELLSSPEPRSVPDILAFTHALILFQIMRLFDGDIRSLATADEILTTLESSATMLLQNLFIPDPTGPTDIFSLSTCPIGEFWESWVLQESTRRTVLFAFYFINIFKLLQAKAPVQCDRNYSLPGDHAFYLSARLWTAPNAFDFAIAWAERKHLVVYDLDFPSAFQIAQPEDVDEFGRMLLVTLLGIDEAKAWFHVQGAIL